LAGQKVATTALRPDLRKGEPVDLQMPEAALRQPLNTLSDARFYPLVKRANVKRIKFHGGTGSLVTIC
jgi:hypothetical protein